MTKDLWQCAALSATVAYSEPRRPQGSSTATTMRRRQRLERGGDVGLGHRLDGGRVQTLLDGCWIDGTCCCRRQARPTRAPLLRRDVSTQSIPTVRHSLNLGVREA